MKLKRGVSVHKLSPQILLAAIVAQDLYRAYTAELIITSANDSKHKEGSKHYTGNAIDIRTRNLNSNKDKKILSEMIKDSLGNDYFVLLESDHIHIQYNGD